MKRLFLLISLIVLGTVISSSIYGLVLGYPVSVTAEDVDFDRQEEPSLPPAIPNQTILLIAAGDCLMHNTQIDSGLQSDGAYSFDTFFADVTDLIRSGDYATTCLETPLAGPASGYTGYPLFNSPDTVIDAFLSAGFNYIGSAHNHILDRGNQGAVRTLEVLSQKGADTAGVYTMPKEEQDFLIKDIRGVKVGYLAYTYSTNGIPLAKSPPLEINMLDPELIYSDIAALRPQVDILILLLHWGVEYSPQPTQEQTELARAFLTAGADVILGSHPHVIQTMELINIDGKNKFVIYSMGNFISHQIGQERNSGIILQLEFTKDFNTDRTELNSVDYIPTFSHDFYQNGRRKFRVVPVEAVIEKIGSGEEIYLAARDIPVLQGVLSDTRRRLGEPIIIH